MGYYVADELESDNSIGREGSQPRERAQKERRTSRPVAMITGTTSKVKNGGETWLPRLKARHVRSGMFRGRLGEDGRH
jgi:hypothetical protein